MFIAAGGMLAWRWPRLFWVHRPAFAYGAAIIGIGFTCPSGSSAKSRGSDGDLMTTPFLA
jgi:hypothetical protein